VCARCATPGEAGRLAALCGCGGTLLYEPDLGQARRLDPERLAVAGAGPRALAAVLPPSPRALTLGEGGTPLRRAGRLGEALGLTDLWIKDETANPSGSFKDRGLALAVGRARDLGARRLALATAGNAGVSAALYAAAARCPLRVVAPACTPEAYIERARALGARVEVAGDDLAEAGVALRRRLEAEGEFDLSTLREPYRVEGKKILGYEILLAMRSWPPRWIVLPTGGGTAILGVDKALGEMEALGWLTGPAPRLAACQAAGCAPVVCAWEAGSAETAPWENPITGAWGLRVPAPLGGARILGALRRRGGAALAVGEEEMGIAARDLSRLERLPAGLEAGAAVAGARTLLARGLARPDDRIVLVVTGRPEGGVDCPQGLI
jgi:threonine synthase